MWFVDGNRLSGDEDKLVIDFNHTQPFVFELDRHLYKQFVKSVPVKIFTRYPKKKFKPVVDEKKEPEFDIEVQQEMLGFALLDLSPLLKNNAAVEQNQKYQLYEYDEKHLNHYSIYWPVKDEQTRVAKLAEEVEKERLSKQKKPEEPVDVPGAKKGAAAAKKPAVDPKKKKPAQAGKKGKEEEEQKIVVPTWPVNPRKVVCYEVDRLARHGPNKFDNKHTKVMVAGAIELAAGITIH